MIFTNYYRFIIIFILAAVFQELSFAQVKPNRVGKIHHQAYVIDTHTDTPMKLVSGQISKHWLITSIML